MCIEMQSVINIIEGMKNEPSGTRPTLSHSIPIIVLRGRQQLSLVRIKHQIHLSPKSWRGPALMPVKEKGTKQCRGVGGLGGGWQWEN